MHEVLFKASDHMKEAWRGLSRRPWSCVVIGARFGGSGSHKEAF